MVAILSEFLALERGFSPAYAGKIRIAALLHDVGKLAIPKAILNKPGKLNADEYEIIKTHTLIGAAMMKNVRGDLGTVIRNVCANHHEWYSPEHGGYWGLRADDLPPCTPIVSICDTFCALIHARPYKTAWSWDDALKYIKNQSGGQFNPALAADFIALVTRIKK